MIKICPPGPVGNVGGNERVRSPARTRLGRSAFCEIFGMTAVVMLLLGLIQHGRLGAAFFRDSERTGGPVDGRPHSPGPARGLGFPAGGVPAGAWCHNGMK